ncbi:MAG: MBL fold metallo-hydrolase [Candidatus Kariarchaeaceae archaeon]
MLLQKTDCFLLKEAILGKKEQNLRITKIANNFEEAELVIRKLLWNEISIDEIEDTSELMFRIIFYYLTGKIPLIDLQSVWHKYYTNNLISAEHLPRLIFILFDTALIETFEDWSLLVQKECLEISSLTPSFAETIEIYNNWMDKSIDPKWSALSSKIASLEKRPEYFQEILTHTDEQDLVSIMPWMHLPIRQQITEYLVEVEIDKLDKKMSYKQLMEHLNQEGSITKGMPVSYQVLKSKIAELPAQPMDMSVIEKIPQKYVQDWAPKYVYSQPEIAQKIGIYFPGGKGIGHSAILIKANDGMILLDFGLSVVNSTIPRWFPLLEKVDAVLLTHAHLDHSGSIPLLFSKESKLPWFGQKETKLMTEMLWNDTSNIIRRNVDENTIKHDPVLTGLSSSSSIQAALNNFHEIKVGESMSILPKVSVTPHNAAHLFGSVGYELDIDGKRILYTGDFNMDGTISFKGAKFPKDSDTTIFDGTYYGRYDEDKDPQTELKHILENSKRIIIPAFSMGRSQEILFRLKQLGAEKQWKIHLTGMGGRLTQRMNLTVGASGGGKSSGISISKTLEPEDFVEKSIVIAGQGMLQVGTSRNLFDYSMDDPDTSVILCGYQAPNTMGYHLLQKHPYLQKRYQQQITRIKLSGHTKGKTLDSFIDSLDKQKIMVHSPTGAYESIQRLDIKVPQNLEPVSM